MMLSSQCACAEFLILPPRWNVWELLVDYWVLCYADSGVKTKNPTVEKIQGVRVRGSCENYPPPTSPRKTLVFLVWRVHTRERGHFHSWVWRRKNHWGPGFFEMQGIFLQVYSSKDVFEESWTKLSHGSPSLCYPLKRRQETIINGETHICLCFGQGIKVFITQEEMLGLVSVLKISGLGKELCGGVVASL